MADNGESYSAKLARLTGTAVLVGGAGYAAYKGYQESEVAQRSLARALAGPAPLALGQRSRNPVAFREDQLKEAFTAANEIMSESGWKEMLRKTYGHALYKAGVVADKDREKMIEQLISAGTSYESVSGSLSKFQHQLGGSQEFYQSLRELAGGTVTGRRNQSVSELIRGLSSGVGGSAVGARAREFGTGLVRSAFDPGGKFWDLAFPLRADKVDIARRTDIVSGLHRAWGDRISELFEQEVSVGIRKPNRPRFFDTQRGGFGFNIPGISSDASLPYTEYRIGGSRSQWFMTVPEVSDEFAKRGLNLVAADHRGKAFASMPHFAVPKPGGGYKVVSFNEGISTALFGNEKAGITGLAIEAHQFAGNKKALRDFTSQWNLAVRGLMKRIEPSAAGMTQATLHSNTVIDIRRFMNKVTGKGDMPSMEAATEFATGLRSSGYNVVPHSSPGAVADMYQMSLKDWASEMDVFGGDYPFERRYAARFRPYSLTDKSMAELSSNKIMGILSRDMPITATDVYKKVVNPMPSAVAFYSMGDIQDLAAEEAYVSKSLFPLMETRSIKRYEVLTGSTMAGIGEDLIGGELLGQDYRTGKSLFAKGGNRIGQKIISATQVEGTPITQIDVETLLPGQDLTKIYGSMKVNLRSGTSSVAQVAASQAGLKPGDYGYSLIHRAEMIASADVMKKVPAEIQKQMAEALWLTTAERLLKGGASSRMRAGKRIYRSKGQKIKNVAEQYKYVHDHKDRLNRLTRMKAEGLKTAEALGLVGTNTQFGAGAMILKEARKWGATNEDLAVIGGVYYKQLETALGATEAHSFLNKALGLKMEDASVIGALKASKGVYANPTLHMGGWDAYTERWGRATIDPRQLMEWKAQNWGQEGDVILEELLRNRIPGQDLIETERAALSLAGKGGDLPSNLRKVTSADEALGAIGAEGFLFKYGGKSVYVPSLAAKQMGQYSPEIGEVKPQELRSSYEKLFKASAYNELEKSDVSAKALSDAEQALVSQVGKQYGIARHSGGRVYGSAGFVAHRLRSDNATEILAKEYQSVTDFMADSKDLFAVGATKESGERLFRDAMKVADTEELAFLERQRKAFLAGESVQSIGWRHPTTGAQSMVPLRMQLVPGEEEGVFFRQTFLNKKVMGEGGEITKRLDVSTVAGMKGDFDGDHLQLKLIGNEKAALAAEKLMNSTRWKEQFIQSVEIQYDLSKAIKAAATKAANPADSQFIIGLERLAGVKMETGQISNLVGEMRAAAAFQAKTDDFWNMSHILTELEQSAISSKHGLHSTEVKSLLAEFVGRKGGGKVDDAMRKVWDTIFGSDIIKSNNVEYHKEKVVASLSQYIQGATESKQLADYRRMTRGAAKAAKGGIDAELTTEALYNAVVSHKGGRGDLVAGLIREMGMGPGSGINRSRMAVDAAGDVGRAMLSGLKKHWKIPAIGLVAGIGITALGGANMGMSNHNAMATDLEMGSEEMANVPVPNPMSSRLFTMGSSPFPMGYNLGHSGDLSGAESRMLTSFGQQTGANVRISDDRGAITPQYIDKINRERYA